MITPFRIIFLICCLMTALALGLFDSDECESDDFSDTCVGCVEDCLEPIK